MISGQWHAYAMVVWVVGFCGFLISGFVGFNLLVTMVAVNDFGLWVLWLWVEEREMQCYGGGDCFGVMGVVVVG